MSNTAFNYPTGRSLKTHILLEYTSVAAPFADSPATTFSPFYVIVRPHSTLLGQLPDGLAPGLGGSLWRISLWGHIGQKEKECEQQLSVKVLGGASNCLGSGLSLRSPTLFFLHEDFPDAEIETTCNRVPLWNPKP